jgi:hypothetical protein
VVSEQLLLQLPAPHYWLRDQEEAKESGPPNQKCYQQREAEWASTPGLCALPSLPPTSSWKGKGTWSSSECPETGGGRDISLPAAGLLGGTAFESQEGGVQATPSLHLSAR